MRRRKLVPPCWRQTERRHAAALRGGAEEQWRIHPLTSAAQHHPLGSQQDQQGNKEAGASGAPCGTGVDALPVSTNLADDLCAALCSSSCSSCSSSVSALVQFESSEQGVKVEDVLWVSVWTVFHLKPLVSR